MAGATDTAMDTTRIGTATLAADTGAWGITVLGRAVALIAIDQAQNSRAAVVPTRAVTACFRNACVVVPIRSEIERLRFDPETGEERARIDAPRTIADTGTGTCMALESLQHEPRIHTGLIDAISARHPAHLLMIPAEPEHVFVSFTIPATPDNPVEIHGKSRGSSGTIENAIDIGLALIARCGTNFVRDHPASPAGDALSKRPTATRDRTIRHHRMPPWRVSP